MKTPFLGPAYVARSKNLADQQLVNLFADVVATHTGKEVGGFYMTPGLDLLAILPSMGARGFCVFGAFLVVVYGNGVYQVDSTWGFTQWGTIGTSTGPVSIIASGQQVNIFDGQAGYLGMPGFGLTGGSILNGGTANAIGDVIMLTASTGTQIGTASITVTTVSGGAVTGFTVTSQGSFTTKPTQFTQDTTTGSGSGFILSSPTYTASARLMKLNLPFPNPTMAIYQDSFGLVLQGGSNQWWQSAPGDLSVYPALSFSSADAQGDHIQAIATLNDLVWLPKQTNTEIWQDSGTAGFAFSRVPDAVIEHGCAAPWSVAKVGDSLAWVSQDTNGIASVVMTQGLGTVPISTPALAYAMAKYPTVTDAVAFAYQQEDHLFYQISFPSGNATWVFDVTATAMLKIPMWHQRAAFAAGLFSRHWAGCFAMFNGKRVVGDYRNGNLYAYDLDTLTDNGTQRKWLRSWRALQAPSEGPQRFSSLTIDMETGAQVPPNDPGEDPQVVLQWSDDGGHTFSDEHFRSVGKLGQTAKRVKFNRLGSTRRNSGLDRIFFLSSTDQFKVALLGASIDQ